MNPSNFSWKVFGIPFDNAQYFLNRKNRGRRPTVAIFLQFGHFAYFAIIYAKTVMCTLPIPTGKSLAYVSAIHSILYMVKIVVGGLR